MLEHEILVRAYSALQLLKYGIFRAYDDGDVEISYIELQGYWNKAREDVGSPRLRPGLLYFTPKNEAEQLH